MIPSQPRLKIPAFWLNISPIEAIIRATANLTVNVSVFTKIAPMSCLLYIFDLVLEEPLAEPFLCVRVIDDHLQ